MRGGHFSSKQCPNYAFPLPPFVFHHRRVPLFDLVVVVATLRRSPCHVPFSQRIRLTALLHERKGSFALSKWLSFLCPNCTSCGNKLKMSKVLPEFFFCPNGWRLKIQISKSNNFVKRKEAKIVHLLFSSTLN